MARMIGDKSIFVRYHERSLVTEHEFVRCHDSVQRQDWAIPSGSMELSFVAVAPDLK